MEANQIALVQGTFKLVVPIKETAAELFYNRLFELEPSVRPMFPEDVKEQGKKLMAALATVVSGLTALEQLSQQSSNWAFLTSDTVSKTSTTVWSVKR